MKEDDKELIARAKGGEEHAFRELLRRYERAVYSICVRLVHDREEARDLSQESFIKVFSALDRYDPSYAFSNWLFKITYNLCIDWIRKRRLETLPMDAPLKGETGEFTRQFESPGDNPETEAIKKQQMDKLMAAIDTLPPHYRIMILLRHQEHLSYEEIAETLEIPLGTVKARIHRAREMLKGRLEGEDFW